MSSALTVPATTGTGTAGGAAAGMGLSSLFWPMLLAFAPGLLSKFMFGDPQKKLREQLNRLASPGTLSHYTNQNYQNLLQGPAYSSALGSIASGANQTQNLLGSSLGARGIGTSGTGAILGSLVPSIVGSQQGQLKTAAYGQAQSAAQQQIQAMIAALTGTSGPSQSQQLFAGGMEAFAPLLLQWLKGRQGQGGGWQAGPGQMLPSYPGTMPGTPFYPPTWR